MELYDTKTMPPSNNPNYRKAQERYVKGEIFVNLYGDDESKIKKELGTYQCKSNYCYRAISLETYEIYKNLGFICDNRTTAKEYIEFVGEDGHIYNNNAGIDWYLGGAAPGIKYGMIVIECPADKNYFQPAFDNGCDMTLDPTVRHMKSSPKANPIPFSMITNTFYCNVNIIKDQSKPEFVVIRQQETEEMGKLGRKK